MTNELELYNKILFLELRPWTNKDVAETKYKELNQKASVQAYSFQPCFQLDFIKPLSNKRKYYYSLISNEAVRFLNVFNSNILGSLNDDERKYWAHTTLTKTLSQKLKEIEKIISDNNYEYDLILPGTKSKSTDAKLIDEAYIIQLLKYQLICIYLEIQETYKAYLKEDAISEAELHQLYFSENAPDVSPIKHADKIKILSASNAKQITQTEIVFKKLTADFRVVKKGVLAYSSIIKSPNKFAQFEEQLFANNYIDKDYNFIDEHGKINKFACIYHVLINKGYFNPMNFEKSKKLEHVDIRKFLDHRYNAGTDKQFRSLKTNTQSVSDFQTENYWIDNLAVC
jgi:hypothetical protein